MIKREPSLINRITFKIVTFTIIIYLLLFIFHIKYNEAHAGIIQAAYR